MVESSLHTVSSPIIWLVLIQSRSLPLTCLDVQCHNMHVRIIALMLKTCRIGRSSTGINDNTLAVRIHGLNLGPMVTFPCGLLHYAVNLYNRVINYEDQ